MPDTELKEFYNNAWPMLSAQRIVVVTDGGL